ncbi:hypothetical protein [Flavobacterium sp. 245]|uniref:hypothetical protein n=1 Tax=Flavobacterium sp. 245 TaxID=2512115 RepID=UPI001060324E|nr:hypothetical protein [Flavobacterium sp. 245]TDP00646.1 hypothetical protein EV145_10522 [Flavobacterium sp. 245]
MIEKTIFTLQLIQIDFFTAFGLVTILYFLISIFSKNQYLKNIDEESNRFISFIGIVFLLVWIIGIFTELNLLTEEDKGFLIDRMFGKYWIGFWIQPLLWVIVTQLLRLNSVRKNVLLRIIFAVLLIFSIEKMVIIYTSFQRDYLPSSWVMYNDLSIYPSNLILELLMKIVVFLLSVGIFFLINRKINERKTAKLKSL